MQPARLGGRKGRRGLTDDAAGLLGGQRTVVDDPGQRPRLRQRLLDDGGDIVLHDDVENAHQAGVFQAGRPARDVDRGGGIWRTGRERHGDDRAVEGGVVAVPPLPPGGGRETLADGIPLRGKQAARSQSRHGASLQVCRCTDLCGAVA